jgi:hypothetical protein
LEQCQGFSGSTVCCWLVWVGGGGSQPPLQQQMRCVCHNVFIQPNLLTVCSAWALVRALVSSQRGQRPPPPQKSSPETDSKGKQRPVSTEQSSAPLGVTGGIAVPRGHQESWLCVWELPPSPGVRDDRPGKVVSKQRSGVSVAVPLLGKRLPGPGRHQGKGVAPCWPQG